MFCSNCGATLHGNPKFCPSCGKAVQAPEGGSSTDGETSPNETSQNLSAREIFSGLVVAVVGIGTAAWLSNGGADTVLAHGLDAEVQYCEHRLSNCEWDSVMDNRAYCTFTNTAEMPVNTRQFRTWSYSNSGVKLRDSVIGLDLVEPGRSAKVELRFDMQTDKAYVCSMDPESSLGRSVVGPQLKTLTIN